MDEKAIKYATSNTRLSDTDSIKKKGQFYMQLAVSMIVLIWSIIMLSTNVDPNNNTVYFSLVSSILSLFLPSPIQNVASK